MKQKILSSFALIAVMLALSSPSPAFGKHPQIEDALRALRGAKDHLNEASHDFGGHRVEAIKAIDHSIIQLEKALKFDKK